MRQLVLAVAVVIAYVLAPVGAQQNLRRDVEQERAKYGPTLNEQEAVQILNAVAFKHKDDGWGLSRKDGGTNCRSTLFEHPVACDILHHKPSNQLFDVLIDNAGHGGPANPDWRPAGPPMSADRTWTAPVEHGGGGGSTPPVCEQCPPDLSGQLAACVADKTAAIEESVTLRNRVVSLERDLESCRLKQPKIECKSFLGFKYDCKVVQ